MSDTAPDSVIAAVFATPAGSELLAWMEADWPVLTAPLIREAIARERKRWSTGGDVTERAESRAPE